MLTRWLAVAMVAAGVLPAQVPVEVLDNGVCHTHVEVVGARHLGLCVRLPFGAGHDPAGRSGRAAWAGELVRAAAAEHGWNVRVATALAAVELSWSVPAGARQELAAFLRALGAAELPWSDDLLSRARARARLHADDRGVVLPGPVLRQRGRALRLAGSAAARPLWGTPEGIAANEVEALRRAWPRLAAGRRLRVASVGAGEGGSLRAALAAWPAGTAKAPAPVVDDPPRPPAVAVHPLVDGPYVGLPLPAPGADAAPEVRRAFDLAMAVLERRAVLAFGDYQEGGREERAEFPFLWWRPELGVPQAFLGRRGPDGMPWGRTAEELLGFVSGVLERPVAAEELDTARRLLAFRTRAPGEPRSRDPRLARRPFSLEVAARNLLRRSPEPEEEVPVAAVERALAAALAPARSRGREALLALRPRPQRR